MKIMKVLIFTEGGTRIGLGHISRCSSLYDELTDRGIETEFIINGSPNEVDLISSNIYFKDWLSKEFLINYIKETDYCIVDSYLADISLYKVISEKSKRCLFIDDNARIKYPKGIVVNPSLNTEGLDYYLNDDNNYLLGLDYIILRQPFINLKREAINNGVKEVLVTMGGADPNNLTPTILNLLNSRFPNITYNVVVSKAYKNLDKVKEMINDNILFYENATAEEMKRLMLKSDIAITAAGQTIYELLATQTPFIPILVADNQKNNIAGLMKLNLAETIIDYRDKLFREILASEFIKLLDYKKRCEISCLYTNVVDGLGSKRIIDQLLAK